MATPISIDVAGELDNHWMNSGMPDDGIRIVGHRVNGNRYRTFLTVPGDKTAPHYELHDGVYLHTAGPSLEAWLEQHREYIEQQEYARHSQDASELRTWAGGA